MTVTTVFATAPGGNGLARGVSATYATARETGTNAANDHSVGQNVSGGPTYACDESFLIFDTSAIDDADPVTAVVLSLDGLSDSSTTDFVATAASSAYNGGAVVVGDFVAGSALSALTTYATWDSSGYSASYNAFTSAGAAFNNAINKTGNTPIMLYSDRHSAGTTPTGAERVSFVDADAGGTTTDPKLDITHGAAAAGQTWIGGKGKFW